MVYKKITDNIPSLSSLLLAGIVFGSSNCPGKDTPDGKGKDEETNASPKPVQESETKLPPRTPEDQTKFGDIFTVLIELAQIDHLKHAPMVMEKSDFEGPQGKSNVEALFKSFGTSQAYPPRNTYFTALGNADIFTFKSGVTGSGGRLGSKAAYGEAVNEIARVYKGLHEFYEEMTKQAKDGARVPAIQHLLSRVETFYNNNIMKEDLFVGGRAFQSASKQVKILDGGHMARFMTNLKSNRGRDIMPRVIESVWVKLKVPNNACQNSLVVNSKALQRGSTIQGGEENDPSGNPVVWNVSGEKNTHMPHIKRINNVTMNGATESAGYIPLPDNNAATPVPNIQEAPSGMAAKKTTDKLTFGQLFFALFTGVKDRDIFRLEENSKDKVKFFTKNPTFQTLLEAANKGDDAFAEYLGKHIENLSSQSGSVDDIFVIPDIGSLRDRLIPKDIEIAVKNIPANLGGTAYVAANATTGAGVTLPVSDPNSIVGQLLKRIFSASNYNHHTATTDTGVGIETFRTGLAAIGIMMDYNLSFEQKVCIKLANILSPTASLYNLAYNTVDPASGEQFLSHMKTLINAEANGAIVKKENGGYKPTPITNKFRVEFKNFVDRLLEKQDDKSITYDKIKEDTRGDVPNTNPLDKIFDIKKVRDAMESDCNAIKSVLESAMRIDPVLTIKEKEVDYTRYFKVSGLSTSNYKRLDDIRLRNVPVIKDVVEEKKKNEVIEKTVKAPEVPPAA
ncbi:hypothetical protein [Candidatus Cardinium hertigii]|jgi:hypothetical protein|uniref:Uncharacterized protein n=1 Tax=Candidatus Cardinium hertigii TaxID=247481 RepID=A0A3N2QCN5_9BACT|nr:hypothetical protein [Candidatus Cardinium hertigii]ROT47540.1 hypothetical protein EDM02_02140 [Candidatus Cardinium hertigii]